jgi:hypothetical protein
MGQIMMPDAEALMLIFIKRAIKFKSKTQLPTADETELHLNFVQGDGRAQAQDIRP